LTLTHSSAREIAYIIKAIDEGYGKADELKAFFQESHSERVNQHIRFAQFWYKANGLFTDLKEHTSTIAADAGLTLDSDEAFQWLGTGGFVNDGINLAGIGGYNVSAVKTITQTILKDKSTWLVGTNNVFELDAAGSDFGTFFGFHEGRIVEVPCVKRGGHNLPLIGAIGHLVEILDSETHIVKIKDRLWAEAAKFSQNPQNEVSAALDFLEAMVHEGWVKASHNPDLESMSYETQEQSPFIRSNNDEEFSMESEN
jgi:hypothetical protein